MPENSVSAAHELSPDGMFELDAELDGSPMDALRIDLCQWHSAIAKVVCLNATAKNTPNSCKAERNGPEKWTYSLVCARNTFLSLRRLCPCGKSI